MDPVEEKAQHEPHEPWFLTGVTAPSVLQSRESGSPSICLPLRWCGWIRRIQGFILGISWIRSSCIGFHRLRIFTFVPFVNKLANWLISSHGMGMHTICSGSWIGLLMASYQIAAIKAVVAISPGRLLPFCLLNTKKRSLMRFLLIIP